MGLGNTAGTAERSRASGHEVLRRRECCGCSTFFLPRISYFRRQGLLLTLKVAVTGTNLPETARRNEPPSDIQTATLISEGCCETPSVWPRGCGDVREGVVALRGTVGPNTMSPDRTDQNPSSSRPKSSSRAPEIGKGQHCSQREAKGTSPATTSSVRKHSTI